MFAAKNGNGLVLSHGVHHRAINARYAVVENLFYAKPRGEGFAIFGHDLINGWKKAKLDGWRIVPVIVSEARKTHD